MTVRSLNDNTKQTVTKAARTQPRNYTVNPSISPFAGRLSVRGEQRFDGADLASADFDEQRSEFSQFCVCR